MSVITTRYVKKPLHVDAVQITEKNFEEVAAWCQGKIQTDESDRSTNGKRYIKVRVHNPFNPRQTQAFVGDWLLYTEMGYKIYTPKAFLASFDEASTVLQPVAYPYDGGGVTVLGPEIFVSEDRSVLCWRGQNYVPQEESQNGTSNTEDEELIEQQPNAA